MKLDAFKGIRPTPLTYFTKLEKSYQDADILIAHCKENNITIENAEDDYFCFNDVNLPEYNKLDKFKGSLSIEEKQNLRKKENHLKMVRKAENKQINQKKMIVTQTHQNTI